MTVRGVPGAWRQVRAPILALACAGGLLFDGLNSMFGNGIVCLTASLLLVVLVLTGPPPARFWRRGWPVLAAIAAAGGWAGMELTAGGRWAVDGPPVAPDLGASALVGFAGAVAALLCGAVAGARRVSLGPFVDWLLLSGCVTIVAALAWRGDDGMGFSLWTASENGRFFGTLGNANAAAAVYGGLAVLALARALEMDERLWQPGEPLAERLHAGALWVALLICAGACLLTASRMGAVLGAMALAAVAARGRRGRSLLLGGALVAVAAVGLSALLIERFDRLPDELSLRLLMWRHDAAIAAARPWSGYGLGGFPSVNARYLGDVQTAQALWMTNSPHDVALRLTIDAGLPYLSLLALAAIVATAQVARAARRGGLDPLETGLAAAVLIALGSASVDIALEVPGVAAMTLVFAGLLWGRALARR